MNAVAETKKKKVREPLFHIVKRDAIPWWKSWLIRIAAVICALIVVALITILLTKQNPIEMYKAMIRGTVGKERKTWEFLRDASLLLLIALAITPAFKMRFWNIGAQGQVLVGMIAATACMKFLTDKVSLPVLFLLMSSTAIIAGAVWAFIPGLFKATLNTNETLFTLMMNYIAIYLVDYFCSIWADRNNKMSPLNRRTKIGWFPSIGNQDSISSKFLLGIIIVAVVTVVMFIYLKYSKHGYEISVVGESENTARYIGINVKKVIIRTVIISGAICGLAGFILVSGVHHTLDSQYEAGMGFTAIIVSWMSHFNPFYMVIVSLLIVFLQKGSAEAVNTKELQLDSNYSGIVTGIIILFIIGCEFFINYRIQINKNRGKAGKEVSE